MTNDDYERRYKLSVQLIRLNECGLVTDDELWTIRRWLGLNSFIWVAAETEKEKNNECRE